MLLENFINKFDVANEKEIIRVIYLAYFHYKHAGIISFSYDDIAEWFSSQNWSKPNKTRLLKKIRDSKYFIKGDTKDTNKINGKKLPELEEKFDNFNFEEVYLKLKTKSGHYVDTERLLQLKDVSSDKFDLKKVIEICDELNIGIKTNCVLAVGTLVRMLIDHVPPIFECSSFGEVCNNYNGTKSFKQSMKNLDSSSRKIADRFMHTQIRRKESLPTTTQIDFTNDVDVLLEEIVRVLK